MKHCTAYYKPTSIHDAVALLREHPGKGAFIAGGTNIVVAKDPTLDYLIDVHHLGLGDIREDDTSLRIGACVTLEALYHSPLVNTLSNGLFAQMCGWFASKQIRNVATIGGNIAEGLSAADTAPVLMAMDAQAVLVGETERIVPLSTFFRKQGGTILDHELITEFMISKEFQEASGKFLKNGKTREDISVVSVTTVVLMKEDTCQKARIAMGAVAPTPIRVHAAEAVLEGQTPTPELIEQTADVVVETIHPIDNFRGTAQFRKEISRVYAKRALGECFDM